VFESRSRTLVTERMLGVGEVELFAHGHAPCVVALHGFGGTAAELRPVLDRVVEAGYAVDAALLPGHGSSVTQLQDKTFDDWVEASRARARAAAREHGRVVLLGFSLGSLIAMQIASERPEWLAGLVVLGAAVTLEPHSSVPLALLARLGMRIPDVYMLKPRAGDLVDPALMDRLVSYDRHPLRASLEVYLAGPRVRAGVGLIDCPTLIVHGRRDQVCPWTNAVWLAEHIGTRDVSVRIFEKSGHVVACDGERAEVAREVVTFFARLRA
jgi:carboxylesterase